MKATCTIAVVGIFAAGAPAGHIESDWCGGGDGVSWHDADNWSPALVPDNDGTNRFSATIDSGAFVEVDEATTVDDLTTGSADTVHVRRNHMLGIDCGAGRGEIVNRGTLRVDRSGSLSTAIGIANGTATLSGGGELRLEDTSTVHGSTYADGLINVDNVISGAGGIGYTSPWGGFANHGLVEADDPTGALNLGAGEGGSTNAGLMQASSGGTLCLCSNGQTPVFDNAGGTIRALDGSTVYLWGVEVVHGTLDSAGTGSVNTRKTRTATLRDLTNAGSFVTESLGATRLAGTIHNTGTITAQGRLVPVGSVTLSGEGLLLLDGGLIWNSDDPSAALVNSDNTIRGDGEIRASLLNHHVVSADRAGETLTLGREPKVNDGTFMATAGGTLEVSAAVTGDGRWIADGGVVILSDAQVSTTGPIEVCGGGRLGLLGWGCDNTMTGSDLHVGDSGKLAVEGEGEMIRLTGSVDFEATDEGSWVWTPDSLLALAGGQGAELGHWSDWTHLEVGGEDLGPDPNGYVDNFHLESLALEPGARVYLDDFFNNGNRGGKSGTSEALYVRNLVLGEGAVLNLNGLHAYWGTVEGTGSLVDQAIPEPCAIGVLVAGSVALLGRRRRFRR